MLKYRFDDLLKFVAWNSVSNDITKFNSSVSLFCREFNIRVYRIQKLSKGVFESTLSVNHVWPSFILSRKQSLSLQPKSAKEFMYNSEHLFCKWEDFKGKLHSSYFVKCKLK